MATIKVNYNDIKYNYLAYPLGSFGVMLLVRADIDADLTIGDYIEFEGDSTSQSKTLMVNTVKAVSASQLVEGSQPAQYTNTTVTTIGVDNLKDDNIEISSITGGYKLLIKGETNDVFNKYVILNTELSQDAEIDAKGAYSPVIGWIALYSNKLKRYINYTTFNVGNYGPSLGLQGKYISHEGYVYGESPFFSGVRVFNNVTMPKINTFGIGEILIYPGNILNGHYGQYGQGVLGSESVCSKVFEGREPINIDPSEPSKPGKNKKPAQKAPDISSHYGGGDGDYDYSSDAIDLPEIPDIKYNSLGVAGVWVPSKEQLKDVFKKIWSKGFFTPILDIFGNNSPLDAIISVRHYPFKITTSGTATMALGTISTDVDVNIAKDQFVKIVYDGKVKHFSDDFNDYEPHLDVSLHLPFVGFVKLDTNTVMGRDIRVQYTVDITTGGTLVIILSKDDKGNFRPLYEYETQLGYDIPVTAMDNRNQSRNMASFAVSTMMAMASMGSSVPASQMALSATAMTIGGSMTGGSQLQKSGSVGGSAGCMDTYDVYIVYKCPSLGYPYKDHPGIHGYKTAGYIRLSNLKGDGYTEAEFVNCAISGATADEMIEIENIVKSGVIL